MHSFRPSRSDVSFYSRCPEIWEVDNGRLTHKGKVGIIEDAFDDQSAKVESREATKAALPAVSKGAARMAAKLAARTPGKSGSNGTTPATSASNTPIGTPAGSGDEAPKTPDEGPKIAKKKLSRKQVKEREVCFYIIATEQLADRLLRNDGVYVQSPGCPTRSQVLLGSLTPVSRQSAM